MAQQNVHPEIPEILMVSNIPPADRKPPPQPDPPRKTDGSIPIQFPHRRGWHTDQSYRRPPPDISLLLRGTGTQRPGADALRKWY